MTSVDQQCKESNKEELWNNWFTFKEINCEKPVLNEQEQIGEANQPITGELAEMNERVNAEKAVSVKEEIKQNEQTLEIIIATIHANDSDSKIECALKRF